jgi:hypothetical protein
MFSLQNLSSGLALLFVSPKISALRLRAGLGLAVASTILLHFGLAGAEVQIASSSTSDSHNNHFGDNWQPRPLIDNSKPTSSFSVNQPKKPQIDPAISEARLAPYEGFIKAIEKSLSIVTPAGSSRVKRLNNIQQIVFNEQPYRDDASELLKRLEGIFPKEATQTLASIKPASPLTSANNQATIQGLNQRQGPQIISSQEMPQSTPTLSQRELARIAKAQKKAQRNAENDFFGGDPFFKEDNSDSFNSSTSSSAGMKAKAVMAGLAGVALAAGGVAGSYYMNRNTPATSSSYGYGLPNSAYPYPNSAVINPYGNTILPNGYSAYPVYTGQAYNGLPVPLGYGYPQGTRNNNNTNALLNSAAAALLGNGLSPGYYNNGVQGYNVNGIQSYNSNGVTYYGRPPY